MYRRFVFSVVVTLLVALADIGTLGLGPYGW